MTDRQIGYRRARKVRDRAVALPLVGFFLLMPPTALIFHSEIKVFGLPFTLVYLFAVWAALILAARFLARPLQQIEDQAERDEDDVR